jgi:hypothetical protein
MPGSRPDRRLHRVSAPSSDALLHQVRATVLRAGGRLKQVEPERVVFGIGDREASLCMRSLRSLATAASPEQIQTWIDARVTQTILAMKRAPRPITHTDLLPRLRTPGSAGAAWFTRIADDHLHLCLITDESDTLRYLSPMDVVGLGLTLDAAQRVARNNLYDRAPQGRWIPSSHDPNTLCSQVGDGHDGSRVLIADRWIADPAGLYVLAPTRDRGFVVPASTENAKEHALVLEEAMRDLFTGSAYPISSKLFWLHNGVLKPASGW